jgi:6-phosphogluconolactonase
MIQDSFINDVPIPSNQIFFIESEIGNVAAANKYNLLLSKEENFDLVLLGFGEDGHTASLFPGHELDDTKNAVAIFNAPKPPSNRVSMTASRLSRTKKILYLVSGSNKSDAFQRWNEKNDLPVSKITAKNELVIYSFDI